MDHIVPRNQGGSDDLSNLQALCFRCNAAKRDGCLPTQEGSTDFRGLQASYASREAGCVFCALEGSGRVLLENELALCIADAYPVSEGHSLVIPRRHVSDGLALHQPEWNAVVELLKTRREQLSAQDAAISGWTGSWDENRGLNSGEAAGQTVFHAHWHLIPRREGDCEHPRGGVRGGDWGEAGVLIVPNALDLKRGTALAKQSALRTRLLHLDVIHYLQAKRQKPHQGFPQQALAH